MSIMTYPEPLVSVIDGRITLKEFFVIRTNILLPSGTPNVLPWRARRVYILVLCLIGRSMWADWMA